MVTEKNQIGNEKEQTREIKTGARGPVQRTERTLAPDLARGAMLLFIALANSVGFFMPFEPGFDTTPHGVERGWNFLMNVLIHARAFPMFGVMFGYGLIQLTQRQDAASGNPLVARKVLLKRNGWLILFGFLHAALLYYGDFLGGYGIVGILITLLLLRRGARVHAIALWIQGLYLLFTIVLAVLVVLGLTHDTHGTATLPGNTISSLSSPDYLSSVMARLSEWPIHTLTLLGLILIVWLGVWAARHRILEEPARHVGKLVVGTMLGLGVAIGGGVPMGLFSAGYLHPDEQTLQLITILHQVSGMFGGMGFVSLFGLISLALMKRSAAPRANLFVGALAALGQRSLSGYLFQSLSWVLLASPYTLALGSKTSSPTFVAAGCSVAVWLVTVAAAGLMQRCSYRGPAETLLRRLTYGKQHTPRPSSQVQQHL